MRTVIVSRVQKAIESLAMQIAHTINQVANHNAAGRYARVGLFGKKLRTILLRVREAVGTPVVMLSSDRRR